MLLDCRKNNFLSLNSSLIGAVDPEVMTLDSFKNHNKNSIDYLSMVFKLNLLLSKHLYIPSGYIFDNPNLHRLLASSESLRNILSSPTDEEGTILLIGIDAISVMRLTCEDIFSNWLYGLDGARINKPCAPLFLSNIDFHKELTQANKNDANYSFSAYFSSLYPNQHNYTDLIRKVIESSTQVLYPEQRHALYKQELQTYFENSINSGNLDLRTYENLLEFIRRSKKVSRSQIKTNYKNLWLNHLDQFIYLRQKTYFGGNAGCLSPNYTSDREIVLSSYLDDLVAGVFSEERNQFRIVLDRLTFDDIRKIRDDKYYIESTSALDSLLSKSNNIGLDEIKALLRKHWAPALFSSVRSVNKSAIIDDKSKRNVMGVSLSGISGILSTMIGGNIGIAFAVLAACTSLLYTTEWYGYRNSLVKFRRDI